MSDTLGQPAPTRMKKVHFFLSMTRVFIKITCLHNLYAAHFWNAVKPAQFNLEVL